MVGVSTRYFYVIKTLPRPYIISYVGDGLIIDLVVTKKGRRSLDIGICPLTSRDMMIYLQICRPEASDMTTASVSVNEVLVSYLGGEGSMNTIHKTILLYKTIRMFGFRRHRFRSIHCDEKRAGVCEAGTGVCCGTVTNELADDM